MLSNKGTTESIYQPMKKKLFLNYLTFVTSVLVFTGCSNKGLTVSKGETLPFLADTFRKSKNWFSSSNESIDEPADAPPPSPPNLSTVSNTKKPPLNSNSKDAENSSGRMQEKDYSKAIRRLSESVEELSKKHGDQSMEVGETYHTIGAMEALQKNNQNALLSFEKAHKIFTSWLGKEHPRVWKLEKQMSQLRSGIKKSLSNRP